MSDPKDLIRIVASDDPSDWTDYEIPVRELSEFCCVPAARACLLKTLETVIQKVREEYPSRASLMRRVDELTDMLNRCDLSTMRPKETCDG